MNPGTARSHQAVRSVGGETLRPFQTHWQQIRRGSEMVAASEYLIRRLPLARGDAGWSRQRRRGTLMEPGTGPMGTPAGEPESAVGRVQGILDSTPLLWHVAVQDGAYLQLDDVVVTVRDVPGRGLVTTAGIITEVCARHEGASFGSD